MHDAPLTAAVLRQFGLLLGAMIVLVLGWFLPWHWNYGYPYWPWGILLGLGGLALVAPLTLTPVYRGWMCVGLVLGAVNSRILLGLVFYLVVTPLGLTMRGLGVAPLRLHREPQRTTYRTLAVPRAKRHFTRPF